MHVAWTYQGCNVLCTVGYLVPRSDDHWSCPEPTCIATSRTPTLVRIRTFGLYSKPTFTDARRGSLWRVQRFCCKMVIIVIRVCVLERWKFTYLVRVHIAWSRILVRDQALKPCSNILSSPNAQIIHKTWHHGSRKFGVGRNVFVAFLELDHFCYTLILLFFLSH